MIMASARLGRKPDISVLRKRLQERRKKMDGLDDKAREEETLVHAYSTLFSL